MKKLFSVIYVILVSVLSVSANDENVVIVDRSDVYKLQSKDGRLASVKHIETTTYLAMRADDVAAAFTFYNDDISVDKATAPGVRPVYRQWIPEDVFYTDSRICFLGVPLKKGKPAKVIFERTMKDPAQFCEISLAGVYDMERSVVTVSVPSDISESVYVEPRRLPETATFRKIVAQDGSTDYIVEISAIKAFKNEPKSGAASADAPALIVKGYFPTVNDLYGYFRRFLENENADMAISDLVKGLTSGIDDPVAKIDTIADWVRNNIRYVAVEHGEYALRPDSAAAVLHKRYGDCKGSANLLRAMFRAAEIDGRMAWIGTSLDVPFDWKDVPSLASGNHAIAAAVLSDTVIYVDGTATYAPAGYCPPSIQGRPVLVEDGENVIYSHVPYMPAGTDVESLCASYVIADGELRGQVSRSYGGFMRMGLLNRYFSEGALRRETLLRNILLDGMKGAEISDLSLEYGATNSAEASISGNLISKGAVQTVGPTCYVNLRPFRDVMMPVSLKNRTRDIGKTYPVCREVCITLKIPDGCEVVVPGDVSFDTDWYHGDLTYAVDVDNGAVKCVGSITFTGAGCELARIAEYNAAAEMLKAAADARVVLKSR